MERGNTLRSRGLQLGLFAGLAALAVALTAAAHSTGSTSFRGFFGGANPLVVVVAVAALGGALVHQLQGRLGLAVWRRHNRSGLGLSAALAVPFAVVMILVDRQGAFPAGLNVPFPGSLAFYPAMAFVAEILFQVVPLAVLAFVLGAVAPGLGRGRILSISVLAASLAEPLYQARLQLAHSAAWAVAYVALHVYLMSLVQLSLYRRRDLLSMYAFRLSYYLIWHIIWGYLRLELLF